MARSWALMRVMLEIQERLSKPNLVRAFVNICGLVANNVSYSVQYGLFL
jgi:hypothetical protein